MDDNNEEEEVIDFAAISVGWFAKEKVSSDLPILTISENMSLNEKIGDTERQSRFHSVAQLIFETILLCK